MEKAPTDAQDLWRFIDEIPNWTAKKHGKKYRLMYQVYTHPKYREYGQKFFERFEQNKLIINRFRADCGSCSE